MSNSIGYLGPAGTYTEQAALLYSPQGVLTPYPSITAVGAAVSNNEVNAGVVPIENSLEGSVTFTLDLLIAPVRPVHPERGGDPHRPLPGCRAWRGSRVSGGDLLASSGLGPVPGVPGSALSRDPPRSVPEHVRRRRRHAGQPGAGPRRSAPSGPPKSTTCRSWTAGYRTTLRTRPDSSSSLMPITLPPAMTAHPSASHSRWTVPGTSTAPLANSPAGTSTWSRSRAARPSRKLGRYIFLIDCEGHRHQPEVAAALEGLRRRTDMLKILGSYPFWEPRAE